MSVHSWCRDVQRDEAVRAAEDGRIGPLPTLAEAISAARAMMPKSVSGSSAPERENEGNGMRTERVTLEITWIPPSGQERIKSWLPSAVLERWFGAPGESVRVVEEMPAFAPATAIAGGTVLVNGQDMVTLAEFLRHTTRLTQEAGAAKAERDALRARVAELESAPPARGWLTEEERDLIAGITDDDDYTDEGQNIATAILARSTPPKVVLPSMPDCSPMADYGAAWRDCIIAVRESLRRAGVNMQQPLSPEVEGNG